MNLGIRGFRFTLAVACLFLAVGVGVLWKQSRAKDCPAHSKTAGHAANAIALIALIAAVALFGVCWALSNE